MHNFYFLAERITKSTSYETVQFVCEGKSWLQPVISAIQVKDDRELLSDVGVFLPDKWQPSAFTISRAIFQHSFNILNYYARTNQGR